MATTLTIFTGLGSQNTLTLWRLTTYI